MTDKPGLEALRDTGSLKLPAIAHSPLRFCHPAAAGDPRKDAGCVCPGGDRTTSPAGGRSPAGGAPPTLLAPRGLRGGRPGRATGPRCGRAAGHGTGVTGVSAGTRHAAPPPPKKAKSTLVIFSPFKSRILPGTAAARAADAAWAADSRPRHTRTSGSRIPRLFSLNPAVPTPPVHNTKHRSPPLELVPDRSVESQAILFQQINSCAVRYTLSKDFI